MWWDISPEALAEWEDWHTHEHMPERLGIPGFLRGTRHRAVSGEPSFFVLYETASVRTLTEGPYLERLNNPTPWSLKMMPHHRNMVRSVCRVRASFGVGVPGTVATIRFSPLQRKAKQLMTWLGIGLPELVKQRGLSSASLLHSEPMGAAPQTAEQKIRGGDAAADWVLLLGGYEAAAVTGAINELQLEAHGAAPGRLEGLYRPVFCLTPKDLR
jgi:hypothetical protein